MYCQLTFSTKLLLPVYEIVVLSKSGLANMEATRTTGRGTSRGTNFTVLDGIVQILIFLKDLVLGV